MSHKSQAILDTAERLFYAHGFHAVGIDRIIKESGIAKMTMYNNFNSKDELISEVLRQRDERFRRDLFGFVEQFPEPDAKIRAFFIWHDRWINTPDFNGCMFIHCAAEYSDCNHPAYHVARMHKQAILTRLREILSTMYAFKKADQLAVQLLQILDGAVETAFVCGNKNAMAIALETANLLLAQTPQNPQTAETSA